MSVLGGLFFFCKKCTVFPLCSDLKKQMDSKLPSIFFGTHNFLSTQVLYQGILDVFADPESVVAIGKDSGFD